MDSGSALVTQAQAMRQDRPSLALGVVALLVLSRIGLGDEPPSKEEPPRKCAELISQLASPNNAPIRRNGTKGRTKLTFPEGYDVKAQLNIKAVRQTLCDNIPESLPCLVAALGDQRYCMTINWADGDGYYNYSVGQVCLDVIRSRLEVYRDAIHFHGPGHWHHYDYPVSKEWWETRKGKSLAELQIEAIDWAIERRRAEDEEQIAERRKNEIVDLQKLREEIAKSRQPATPHRMLPMISGGR